MYYMGAECMHKQSCFHTSTKSIRFDYFTECNAYTAPLFCKSKMVKLLEKIKIENCLFISKHANNKLPSIFNS